jgi:outer membrane biosynthesis protein TonB
MSAAQTHGWSLRLEQAETSRLAWAFAISLALHLLIFGGYYTGRQFHWWENWHWPAWLDPVRQLVQAFKKKELPIQSRPPEEQEMPLMFVDVNPAQETPEPPKNAPYYSSRNSKAANPDPNQDTNIPKISGNQTEIVKTEDVPRREFQPLQPTPTPPPTPPSQENQEEKKAKPAETRGDITMAKPEPEPRKGEGTEPKPKPATWKEAMARQQNESRLVGPKMKQEGGVKRRLVISSVDARATPFGTYDEKLIEAVQSHWFNLLDQHEYAGDSRGKVILTFRLHYDGRITDLNVVGNSAGGVLGLICEKAIRDPSPYDPWPTEMRLANRGDVRDIQFTFYYN